MSDAEKLAEEIVQALAKALADMDAEACDPEMSFDRGEEILRLEPGLKRALELAREVVKKWREEHHGRR